VLGVLSAIDLSRVLLTYRGQLSEEEGKVVGSGCKSKSITLNVPEKGTTRRCVLGCHFHLMERPLIRLQIREGVLECQGLGSLQKGGGKSSGTFVFCGR